MRIGIVSDTHGRVATVQQALAIFRERDVEILLHCGDIDDVDTVHLFRGWPTHFVFGNCDMDRDALQKAIDGIGATLHERFGQIELAGRHIAWIHGDDKRAFHDLEACDHFEYLFYGHTHQAEQHRTGKTLVVNPGALHRARVKTCIVLDTDVDTVESVQVCQ